MKSLRDDFGLIRIVIGIRVFVASALLLSTGKGVAAIEEFSNLFGVCQGGRESRLLPFVGWNREDLKWSELEPQVSNWQQQTLQEFGRRILSFEKNGMRFLPVLCYNTSWSWNRNSRSVVMGNASISYTKQPNGTFRVSSSSSSLPSSLQPIMTGSEMWSLNPSLRYRWRNYVRQVTGFLRRDPYRIEYFQIWNEAHPASGFWIGADMDAYMELIHLPGSEEIKKLGGKVVYGGWPCCGAIDELIQLLDRHNAWKTIDVIDIHYFPLSAMERLRAAATARGFAQLGIWQTEIGFTPDASYLANLYPRFIFWQNRHSTKRDQFKLFWFAEWSPDDPKSYGFGKCLLTGSKLSSHGESLKIISEYLSKPFKNYEGIQSKPKLKFETDETKSSLEAFRIDQDRIFVAIHLVPRNKTNIFVDEETGNTLHLSAGNLQIQLKLLDTSIKEIKAVTIVDQFGNITPLDPKRFFSQDNKTITCPLPSVTNHPSGQPLTFYADIKTIPINMP